MELYFYHVDQEYIEFLKNAERAVHPKTNVPDVTYSNNQKFMYGAVLSVNGVSYYVPVSSYHKKQQDLILITDKNGDVKGSLRFNYMIPIPRDCLKKFDIAAIQSQDYKIKVSKELAFCRRNRDRIAKRAQLTYEAVMAHKTYNPDFCDFKVLETAYVQYCNEHSIEIPLQQKKDILIHAGLDLSKRTLADFFPESELQFAAITPEQAELLSQQHDLLHAIRQGKQSLILQYHKSDAAVVQARLSLIASQGVALK